MRLQFLGAAGTVTGSRALVQVGGRRLLVDCGMFQGFKQNRLRNWEPLGVAPPDGVLLTHAHIDHSGWLPALVRAGFDGPVWCTSATADLLGLLLPDAARIQEEDAAFANRKGSTRHSPALPLYTEDDARRALGLLQPVPFDAPLDLGPVEARFRRAGHILGASSVLLRAEAGAVLFSGDLGRQDDVLMQPPEPPPEVDALVMESTYGDRLHERVDAAGRLAEIINATAERGGVVLIPSFAVGRAQALLHVLAGLRAGGHIPDLPVVIDSPMARDATEIFLRHPRDTRLDGGALRAMTRGVRFVRSVEESKALNPAHEPMVLISASGMLTGGRVLHHLANLAPARRNAVVFVGFQAPGTRGGRLLQGERVIKIYGAKVRVRCEVHEIGGLSAHADADELVSWLGAAPVPPRRVLLNHGEPAALDALRLRLCELGHAAEVATERQDIDLAALAAAPRPVVSASPEAHQAREAAQALAEEDAEPAELSDLLRFVSALRFDDDSPRGLAALREALQARRSGRLPEGVLLRVPSEGLRRRLVEALGPEALDELAP